LAAVGGGEVPHEGAWDGWAGRSTGAAAWAAGRQRGGRPAAGVAPAGWGGWGCRGWRGRGGRADGGGGTAGVVASCSPPAAGWRAGGRWGGGEWGRQAGRRGRRGSAVTGGGCARGARWAPPPTWLACPAGGEIGVTLVLAAARCWGAERTRAHLAGSVHRTRRPGRWPHVSPLQPHGNSTRPRDADPAAGTAAPPQPPSPP
jgi:hypothetical protein